MPHSLGHFLGLQVHDVGPTEEISGIEGESETLSRPMPISHNDIRLQEGHVFTVEPGLYFIDLLLKKARKNENQKNLINFEKVEEYKIEVPGVRIEDNIALLNDKTFNMTENVVRDVTQIQSLMNDTSIRINL